MKLNKDGIDLLHHFEGCKLKAYQCSAKVWTLGWGNTFYEDGTKVKQGDEITQQRADELFENIVNKFFAVPLSKLLTKKVNENQFSALVSFAYNVGMGNLQKSTLLRLVNENPNDTNIRSQFMRWNKAGGKELAGLTRRRKAEADLYFKA
jgi:lysozyme